MPGTDSDRRQRDESKMRNYFYFHGREDPQSLVAQAVSPEYIPHVIFYSVYVSYPALNPRFQMIIQLPVYIILTF